MGATKELFIESEGREKGKHIDVNKIDPGMQELCTEQGLQVSGNGIIIKLLEKIAERLDKLESHAWKESMDIKRIADKVAPKQGV